MPGSTITNKSEQYSEKSGFMKRMMATAYMKK